MKSKTLFILPTTDVGGTRTSLANLISSLDTDRVDIEILSIKRDGTLLPRLEQAGRVLPMHVILEAAFRPAGYHIKNGRIGLLFKKIGLTIRAKTAKKSPRELAMQLAAADFSGKYDCVFGYQEGIAVELAAQIAAPRKFAWVHRAYDGVVDKIPHEKLKTDFSKFDRVIFASGAVMRDYIATECVPADKAIRIYNTFDVASILEKSRLEPITVKDGTVTLVSLGRFVRVKRYDRIIGAAERLKADGFKFKWYMIGDGELREALQERAHRKQLDDCLVFTGMTDNPYRYIAACDATVISSESEAHPMAATESLILSKPVITTAYAAAKESVADGENGIICENSSDGIYLAVKRFLSNGELRAKLAQNAADYFYDNAAIINEVHNLIDGKF